MLRHLTCNIQFLLDQDDAYLGQIFEASGSEVRTELLERQANGEKLIPSEGCEGFDPVTGCPGHDNK